MAETQTSQPPSQSEEMDITNSNKPSQDSGESPPLEEWTKKAEDGSEECQLALGLYYLKLTESGIDSEDNVGPSIKWLMEASKQGNEIATQKIKHCLQTESGVTEENKEDLVWCVMTSTAEKKIRHASRKMFCVLNPSQANLSQEQYLEAINRMPLLDDRQRKLMKATVKKIGSSVTENDFVKILSRKIQGTLTLGSSEVDDKSADYQSSGYARRVLVYPKQTASDVVDQTLEFASKKGMKIILSFIPTGQIYLLLSIFLYSFLTLSFVLLVVPVVAFYISTAVMIIATLQMFYKRRKKKDSDNLASMLQQFDSGLDLQSTASQYSWNSLTPYLVFFSSLLVMMLSLSLSNKDYIPCAGLFVVSMVMTMFCFYALSDTHDFITFGTLVAHFFASLPVYLAGLPAIPGIKYIYTPFLAVSMGGGFALNLSLPSIVYIFIPFLLVRMAMKDSWSGIYKIVIPHLVCYFWFSISTTIYPYTTIFGIVKAGIGYTVLPFILPLLFVIGVIFVMYKMLLTDAIGKIAITALFLAVPILLSKTELFLGTKGAKLSPTMEKVKKFTMIGFAVLAVVPLLLINTSLAPQSKVTEITWEDYKQLCIPIDGEIIAPYQKGCHSFIGMRARWSGTVQQIQISDIENNVESLVKSLPGFLSKPFKCFYGKIIEDCDSETMTERAFKRCQILHSAGQTCHLDEYDQFHFSVKVDVDGASVRLNAGSGFQSKLMSLVPGDVVDFYGVLKDVGTSSPLLKMKSINCSSRDLPEMKQVGDVDEDIVWKLLQEAVTVTVNFALFPVVSYQPE